MYEVRQASEDPRQGLQLPRRCGDDRYRGVRNMVLDAIAAVLRRRQLIGHVDDLGSLLRLHLTVVLSQYGSY